MNSLSSSPTAGERVVSVDAVRGFALLGIVVTHMVEQYMGSPPPASRQHFGIVSPAVDGPALAIVQLFAVGKFFTMFSLLFGLSFFIQMDRAGRRGVAFGGRFAWRLLVLFAIGMVHHLIYRGDILSVYALLGLLLIPFYRLSDRTLLVTALVLLAGTHRLVLSGVGTLLGVQIPLMSVDNQQIEHYFQAIKSGSLPTIFALNLREGFWMKMEFQFSWFGRGYQAMALFLLGLYIGRHGWHERANELRRWIWRLTIGGLGLALVSASTVAAVIILGGLPKSETDIRTWQKFVGGTAYDWFNLGVAALLMGGFLLLYHTRTVGGTLSRLAPAGQTALTTYVGQSLIGTFILYGHGLNWSGEIGAATAVMLAFLIFAAQLTVATTWLRYFRFGPLEWIWRSATFGRLQPVRARPPAPGPATVTRQVS
jgi:uncharacterized protein